MLTLHPPQKTDAALKAIAASGSSGLSKKAWIRAEQFWSRVDRGAGPDGCWLWSGRIGIRDGYGHTTVRLPGVKIHLAHRAAYYFATGVTLSRRIDLMHTCDNRPCCNPAHLIPGSRLDNMRDASRKNRVAYGERSSLATLTEETVLAIKADLESGLSYKEIAARHNTSRSAVQHIYFGNSWVRAGAKVCRPNGPRVMHITALGERRTVAEWAQIMGVDQSTIRNRLAAGWGEERAVSEPSRRVLRRDGTEALRRELGR